jgi:ligand-binding sensor domain-containing protein
MPQYRRDEWDAAKGFPGGRVYAITQTSDGYLWIGAEKGLVRFDGMNFSLMPRADAAPMSNVLGLAADNDGNLWAWMPELSVMRSRGGKMHDALSGMPKGVVTAAYCERTGKMLLAAEQIGMARYSRGKFQAFETPPSTILSMAETSDGNIWMATRDSGLAVLTNGRLSKVTAGLPDSKVNCLLEWKGVEPGWFGS